NFCPVTDADDAQPGAAWRDLDIGIRALDQALRCRLDHSGAGVAAIIEIKNAELALKQAKPNAIACTGIIGGERDIEWRPGRGVITARLVFGAAVLFGRFCRFSFFFFY